MLWHWLRSRLASHAQSLAKARQYFSEEPLAWTAVVSRFFVNTGDGRVATRAQLGAAGIVAGDEKPELPWFEINGPSDASTMWYAVMRKRERGVVIGTLCIRHVGRQASLEQQGWEEVPVEQIGVHGERAG